MAHGAWPRRADRRLDWRAAQGHWEALPSSACAVSAPGHPLGEKTHPPHPEVGGCPAAPLELHSPDSAPPEPATEPNRRLSIPSPTPAAAGGSDSTALPTGTHVGSHLPQHEQHPHLLLDVHLLRTLPGSPLAVHPRASSGDGCGARSTGVRTRLPREAGSFVGVSGSPPRCRVLFPSPEQVASCLFSRDPTSAAVGRAQPRETEVVQTPGQLCLPPQEGGYMPPQCPRLQSKQLPWEREGHGQRQLARPSLEELWDQHQPQTPRPLSGKAPAGIRGQLRPSMGTGGWGSGHRTQAHCHPHRPNPPVPGSSCRQQLCPGAMGPDLQEDPRREVPGFPWGRSRWRGSQAGGVGLQICNSWMSQK